jgi:hypothetical protein
MVRNSSSPSLRNINCRTRNRHRNQRLLHQPHKVV